MGKRKLTITIGIVGIVVLVIVGWYVMFVHFGRGPAFPFLLTVNVEMEGANAMQLAENPLMAIADSEEAAEEIAELYGITLVTCENGIAVYQTEEDPMQVISRGQENNYPQLSLNFKRELHSDTNAVLFDAQRIED